MATSVRFNLVPGRPRFTTELTRALEESATWRENRLQALAIDAAQIVMALEAVTDDLRDQMERASDREDEDLHEALSRIVDGFDATRGAMDALESNLETEHSEASEELEILENLSASFTAEDAEEKGGGA